MRLTPELLASAYDYFRHTEPFVRWNMPEPEDVDFEVLKTKQIYGDHLKIGDRHRVRISQAAHGRYSSVLVTMAHEMVHLHMNNVGVAARCQFGRDSDAHGPTFRAFAAEVCKHHVEFDPVTF